MDDFVQDDDRIFALTYALDGVFQQSTIKDLRMHYFHHISEATKWLLLSDYYFEEDAPNRVITFCAMPYFVDLSKLQSEIKALAPSDIKHTRVVNEKFIDLLNLLPLVSFSFIFPQSKYWIWDSKDEMKTWLLDDIETIKAYIQSWGRAEPKTEKRLNRLSKSIRCLEGLLQEEKKLKLLPPLYFISVLGGYVGSVLCQEAKLSNLVWFSDRDSTNEICYNLVRELFQITLINITKRNIQFAFTSANSSSDEWYKELTRIPDYLTAAISSLDFTASHGLKDKLVKIADLHLRGNSRNVFLYRFVSDSAQVRIQRMIVT